MLKSNNQKISVIILGIIILIGSLCYSFRNTDISLDTKKSLSIILSSKPSEHHFSTSLKFYDDIRFNAKGFERGFIIDNFEYKASFHNELINTLNLGDTIKVWVDKINSTDNYARVYALEYKGFDYINVDERNTIKSRYNKYGLIVTLYGIFLLANLYTEKGVRLSFTKAIGILLIIIISMYRITK